MSLLRCIFLKLYLIILLQNEYLCSKGKVKKICFIILIIPSVSKVFCLFLCMIYKSQSNIFCRQVPPNNHGIEPLHLIGDKGNMLKSCFYWKTFLRFINPQFPKKLPSGDCEDHQEGDSTSNEYQNQILFCKEERFIEANRGLRKCTPTIIEKDICLKEHF